MPEGFCNKAHPSMSSIRLVLQCVDMEWAPCQNIGGAMLLQISGLHLDVGSLMVLQLTGWHLDDRSRRVALDELRVDRCLSVPECACTQDIVLRRGHLRLHEAGGR